MKTETKNEIVIKIEELYDIILHKGYLMTGKDVHDIEGNLIFKGDLRISETEILIKAKNSGITEFIIDTGNGGGVWDVRSKPVLHKIQKRQIIPESLEKKITEIIKKSKKIERKVDVAKGVIKKMISNIRVNGGKFNKTEVENTVTQLIDVISENENPYSLMAKNIINYDEFLLDHSINVCTIGTAVLYKINGLFKEIAQSATDNNTVRDMLSNKIEPKIYEFYSSEAIKRIATGYFLHDVGKINVDERLLNKKGIYTEEEFKTVKKHSYEYGREILNKNGIKDPLIVNSVIYHHGPIYELEPECYPPVENHKNIPDYVRVCKLADIYDGMTSPRSYKDPINPTEAVSTLFRRYSTKCDQLQLILHSFLKSIGSIPTGSVVKLKNQQKAFVLDSEGPVVVLLTDIRGEKLRKIPEPLNLNDIGNKKELEIDRNSNVRNISDSLSILPNFIRNMYGT